MKEVERNAVITAYGGKKNKGWIDKVKKMSDTQVTAIYLRLKAQGRIC